MARFRPSTLRVALLIAGAMALGACGGTGGGEQPRPSPAPVPSADAGPARGERISIPGAGEALAWGRGRRVAILAHGAAFDAASWEPQAKILAADGSFVIALEGIAPEEIIAAIEHARAELDAESVALVGASAGADASLQALALRPAIADQLITLSVNSTVSGLGPLPKLFIAGEEEPVAELSTELAATSPGEDNEALLLPGSAHAQSILETDQGERALDAIRERLDGGASRGGGDGA